MESEEPLVESSRELRTKAATLIEPLLNELKSEATRRLTAMNNVIDKPVPLPAGWEKRHLGIDNERRVHVLKPDLKGDALCGATILATNIAYTGIKICPICKKYAVPVKVVADDEKPAQVTVAAKVTKVRD